MPRVSPRTILITGASSGIGAALAEAYAAPHISLYLIARNEARLRDVAMRCITRGASVEYASIDVTDADALAAWIQNADEKTPLDLVIANAGISGGTSGASESADQVRQIFAVNVDGVLNTIAAIVDRMCARSQGQIAIMSSLASFRPLPSAPAYSASKAAVRFYGEALAGVVKPHGVCVSVICPGYITTPMTEKNDFLMPFLMSEKMAARRMIDALSCGKRRIAFPKRLYLPLFFLSVLSPRITDFLFDRLPSKQQIS